MERRGQEDNCDCLKFDEIIKTDLVRQSPTFSKFLNSKDIRNRIVIGKAPLYQAS